MSSRKDKKGRFQTTHPDKKYSRGRSKKRPREFLTNRESPGKKPRPSTSSRKLKSATRNVENNDTRNRIIDISILYSELENILCCSQCHGKVKISESGVQGLGFKIDIVCSTTCGQIAAINSSKKVGVKGNAWEVNRRSVLFARALGHGHAGLSTACGIMDFQKPVAQSAFDDINKQLSEFCEEAAKESMTTAVLEETEATPPNSAGLDVSGDGSWRRKGFSSLQGLASVIGNRTGKVLDVAIKNSFCKACSKWEGKQETAEYQEWFDEHEPNCAANHQGSAGKMEVDGICEIFQRSEEQYSVKYHHYIGDGDSKVFKAISEAKPYGDTLVVEKRECIAHVQKRMGTRLRNLKKSLSGKKLADGKTIGGRGRLTAQVIDRLSAYYGKAIRKYPDSVENMYKEIWATFFHMQSTDENPQHHYCPVGSQSWCRWQKAQASGGVFTHKNIIPSIVMEQVRPIYEDLTKTELLQKCLGGFTQNSNESFNNSVWKLVPKTSFSGLVVLKIGVYIAVTCFNDGRSGFLKIMKKFDINPGHSAVDWVNTSDDSRLFHAERKALASTKEARTTRRRAREGIQEDSYAAGAH